VFVNPATTGADVTGYVDVLARSVILGRSPMTMAHAVDCEISPTGSSRATTCVAPVAQRVAIYGASSWLGDASEIAWDDYDRYSSTWSPTAPASSSRAPASRSESHGPLEVSDLVDWKSALAPGMRDAVAAEWSRVMIARAYRRRGLFAAMYTAMLRSARARGARVIAGASVAELRPRYERLGFRYLNRPFRSPFFESSPIYYPAYQVLR
jgi:GNAT superfamily N-acetyltransferase